MVDKPSAPAGNITRTSAHRAPAALGRQIIAGVCPVWAPWRPPGWDDPVRYSREISPRLSKGSLPPDLGGEQWGSFGGCRYPDVTPGMKAGDRCE